MNMRQVLFEEVEPKAWDAWVAQIPDATYLHSSMFLRFLRTLIPTQQHRSFACLDDTERPLALCPLAISDVSIEGQPSREASWNGAPLGAPVFGEMPPRSKRRLQQQIFADYHDQLAASRVIRIVVRHHPVSLRVMAGGSLISPFEILAQGYVCQPQNTVVIELEHPESQLTGELHPSQRKHIAQTKRRGLVIRAYRGAGAETAEAFTRYQEAHRLAAGKPTRPLESFRLMQDLLSEEQATLFVAWADHTPMSFLYCGEFQGMAFGWSQANVKAYEELYSPRHLLEWEAILHYRQRGFRFYEVGTRWFGPQPYYVPTRKELSIAEFKQRFGGVFLPDLVFERVVDRALCESLYRHRLEAFVSATFDDAADTTRSDHENASEQDPVPSCAQSAGS